MNHGFCAELRLECLLCNLKLVFVVNLYHSAEVKTTEGSVPCPMTTYRSEVHQVDHTISESFYLDIDPLVPLLLDSFQVFSRGLINSWRRCALWK